MFSTNRPCGMSVESRLEDTTEQSTELEKRGLQTLLPGEYNFVSFYSKQLKTASADSTRNCLHKTRCFFSVKSSGNV